MFPSRHAVIPGFFFLPIVAPFALLVTAFLRACIHRSLFIAFYVAIIVGFAALVGSADLNYGGGITATTGAILAATLLFVLIREVRMWRHPSRQTLDPNPQKEHAS
jgi:hypothetical protein